MSGFLALLGLMRTGFTVPGFAIFTDLLTGWVCAPGRRTITGIIKVADPAGRRAHDAYHRFVRDGAWSMHRLWQVLTCHLVGRFTPEGPVELACDDTLFHHEGPKVEGAGTFRDAVRSTIGKVVYARGLNLVVITLTVQPPWGGCPLALPVNVRVHKKKDATTTVGHAMAMMHQIADWLPDRRLHLVADGAYATLAGAGLPRTQVTSRMRRDAALYEPAPPRTGRRGRPRTKGDRLPTPAGLAEQARKSHWKQVTVDVRGKTATKLVLTRDVLWYRVNKHALLRLVIVRDPEEVEPDDFFVTTDTTATGAEVAGRYAARWAIEICFRDVKQHLGGQDPQSFKRQGPERAAALSLWLHAATWCWYLTSHPDGRTWTARPWYPTKTNPSFLDALATLRRQMWSQRITAISRHGPEEPEITEAILDTLAYAA
ncbi:transposase [Micrococcus luteus]|uniref:IS701 family transposase n=1 Tax=Micrococcus luteus TaxID=1270 RepID=UPI0033D9DD93